MSRPPETLTMEESEKLLITLLSAPQTGFNAWKYLRNYTMALLMLDAGLRVGEVVQMKVSSFVFCDQIKNAIDMTKERAEKNCERLVPVSDRLQKTLLKMWLKLWSTRPELCEGFAFFENDSRVHLTTRQVQRIIGSASLAAFGREIHPHVLRHTFATRLMRVTSTPVVQQLLGHKHLSSTEVYTHPNGDDCKKAIDKMNSSSS
jgi:site-specific recombinase XerD